MKRFLLFLGLVLLIFACTKSPDPICDYVPEVSQIKLNLEFESLEDSLPAIPSKPQLIGFLSRHPEIRDQFFKREAYPNDSVFINEIFNRFSHPAIDTLLQETHRVFGNGSELKSQFSEAFRNIKYYYPDFKTPKVITIISGLETDVMVSDSVVIIGLDYFLGQGARFKPNMYDYMLRRYNKEFVVPSVILLYGISDRFNKTSANDKSVLADMIAYGKAYAFTKKVLPCTADSVLIGYTQKEIQGVIYNESTIWKKMIDDQVLFGTSHMIKQKYIAERPKTLEISAQCPGRIGMWVGWQIAKQYLTAIGKTLNSLMAEPDAQKIFKESKYKPGHN